jgi:nucleotide-binding universal stress UspA family protein
MIRLKRILFPTDFSNCSKRAQEYACTLAEQFQAELHILHVLVDVALMMPEPGSMIMLPQNYLMDMKQAAEKALEGLLPPTWTQGRRVVRATRMGNPFIEISKYAGERDIDLIVISTHGRLALMHVLLGSVAERVVRKAPARY